MSTKATKTEGTGIEVPGIPAKIAGEAVATMANDFNFLLKADSAFEKTTEKTIPLLQKHFSLPSHEGKTIVPVTLLSRKTWIGLLGLPDQKPGSPSPLPQWVISLTSRLQSLRASKTDRAVFVGGEPTKANSSFFLKGRFKKVSPDLRKNLLLGYLKEACTIGFGADAAFCANLLSFVNANGTTTTIPPSGVGVETPKGKITIPSKKKEEAPSNGQQKTIEQQVAELTKLVAMAMAKA